MIHQGKILLDLKGEAKSKFQAEHLLPMFDLNPSISENHHDTVY
jgi:ABC-type uncharacterized transport system ATPase component